MKNDNDLNNAAYFERLARPQVLSIEEYKPGSVPQGRDAMNVTKISANENNFGTSPVIVDALINHLKQLPDLNRYPDITCAELRGALSKNFGIPDDHFLVGNGLDDVIGMLAQTFISDGDEVIVPTATFGVYESVSALMGADVKRVPMKTDLSIDVDGMIGCLSRRTKAIWLCNPNNPTGTMTTAAEFERLLDATNAPETPPLLIVDQAYIDFADIDENLLDAMGYLQVNPNIVVLRTMSKISGLAALRLGYAIAHPELLSLINRIRQPYTVNALAQIAALVDATDENAENFRARIKGSVIESRHELEQFLDEKGVARSESHANFVFTFCDMPYEKIAEISSLLTAENIFVRTLKHRDGPSGLRLSIGTPDENDRLIKALEKILHDI